ncbi:MAG: hypothetical protein ACI9TY_001577 [Alphaproteobacteria bacterium]|jgi:hypothetical protein
MSPVSYRFRQEPKKENVLPVLTSVIRLNML